MALPHPPALVPHRSIWHRHRAAEVPIPEIGEAWVTDAPLGLGPQRPRSGRRAERLEMAFGRKGVNPAPFSEVQFLSEKSRMIES
jgi:hypothetical protein